MHKYQREDRRWYIIVPEHQRRGEFIAKFLKMKFGIKYTFDPADYPEYNSPLL